MDNNSLIKEWGTILDKYEPLKVLGSGSYGKVFEAIDKTTKKKVAIKKINELFHDLIDTKRILREITLLRFMKNTYIVELLDIIYNKTEKDFDCIYLIFECLPSDLHKLIKSNIYLTLDDVRKYLYHILCGLKYIHSCSVLHRDLKPGNILLDHNYLIKICDFGLARCVNRDTEDEIVEKVQEEKKIENLKLNKHSEFLIKYTSSISSNKEKEDLNHDTNSNNEGNCPSKASKRKIPPKLKHLKNHKKEQMLSVHVASRWYRDPELILIETNYTSSIDVWSAGCIFAELMMMMKENSPTFIERKPLFPGKSCFPLSPPDKNKVKVDEFGFPNEKADQLNLIFDLIGSPSEENMGLYYRSKCYIIFKKFNSKEKKQN